jgi:hypothetical protein
VLVVSDGRPVGMSCDICDGKDLVGKFILLAALFDVKLLAIYVYERAHKRAMVY